MSSKKCEKHGAVTIYYDGIVCPMCRENVESAIEGWLKQDGNKTVEEYLKERGVI